MRNIRRRADQNLRSAAAYDAHGHPGNATFLCVHEPPSAACILVCCSGQAGELPGMEIVAGIIPNQAMKRGTKPRESGLSQAHEIGPSLVKHDMLAIAPGLMPGDAEVELAICRRAKRSQQERARPLST